MFTRTESLKEFSRYYPIVTSIVLIHTILYILTVFPLFPNSLLLDMTIGVNLYIIQGEVWRLITPIFMHSGFSHFLFNSFSLILFGPALEKILGKFRFTCLYLITGILANISTLIFEPLTYTHVGSSGSIYGLFGFYVALTIFRKNLLSETNARLILTITVIGLIMTFIQPNVNVIAHIFGFFSGVIIGILSLSRGKNITETLKNEYRNHKSSFFPQRSIPFTKKSILWGIIITLVIIGILNTH